MAIVFLGLSAALFGRWVEGGGPRKAMFTAALLLRRRLSRLGRSAFICTISGSSISATASLGGFGLGLGYISPVSTLIKWFPDRPGMATGMAIMGFGGGAFIASPLSVWLMAIFRRRPMSAWPKHSSRWALIYFVLHDGRRVHRARAAAGLEAATAMCAPAQPKRLVTTRDVYVDDALKTPQFWLLWGDAVPQRHRRHRRAWARRRPMSQEMFPGAITAVAAAGFVGLLSLFNMGGSLLLVVAVRLHRPAATPTSSSSCSARCSTRRCRQPAHVGSVVLFVLGYGVIISMYGGGFATIPAYLRDMFGTRYVGAIHGRLLTAWSMAGVVGPVLVNYIREYKIAHGVAKARRLQRDHVYHGGAAGRSASSATGSSPPCTTGIT